MSVGYRKVAGGWMWWCEDHPSGGRWFPNRTLRRRLAGVLRIPVASAEQRARRSLLRHLVSRHGREWA